MGIGRIALGTLVVVALAAAPLVLAAIVHPTQVNWRELRFEPEVTRYHAWSGREDAPRRGRTEMEFLAQYERLETESTAFSTGSRQGRYATVPVPCDDIVRARRQILDAQALANAHGQPVDVVVC